MRGYFLGFLTLSLFSCAHSPAPRGREPVAAPRASSTCQPLTSEERERLLEIADPENFPATRYREGPRTERGIEKETDCSHFVHEVYRRAGLPYGFRPTAQLGNAREFDLLPEKDARPGDLMLFRGHVGIVGKDGKIISALTTRCRKHRKSSIASVDSRYFKTFHGQRYVLRYRCAPGEETVASRAPASEKKK